MLTGLLSFPFIQQSVDRLEHKLSIDWISLNGLVKPSNSTLVVFGCHPRVP